MTAWMDLEGIMLSEIGREKKINITWSGLYVESKQKQQKKWKQNQVYGYREQTDGCLRWGGWEWAKWVKEIKSY